MAKKMTAKRRRKLPKSSFGLPGSRKYPMDTPGRARNAKARAAQQHKRGKLSTSAKNRIFAKANRVLRRKSGARKTTSSRRRSRR